MPRRVESAHKLENMLVFKESLPHLKSYDNIILNIRYDPHLANAASLDPRFVGESANGLFLVSGHYRLLQIMLDLLQFQFDVDFEDFAGAMSEYVSKHLVSNQCHELFVEIQREGSTQIRSLQLEPRPNLFGGIHGIPDLVYEIYMDSEFTAQSPLTTFILSNARPGDRALKRMPDFGKQTKSGETTSKATRREVILINTSMGIMCGASCNYAFFKSGRWITPTLSCGARLDPLREALIDVHFLKERRITAHDLKLHEEILVFNSIIGVARGVIVSLNARFKSAPRRKRPASSQKVLKERRAQALVVQENEDRARRTSAMLVDRDPERSRAKELPPGYSRFRFE